MATTFILAISEIWILKAYYQRVHYHGPRIKFEGSIQEVDVGKRYILGSLFLVLLFTIVPAVSGCTVSTPTAQPSESQTLSLTPANKTTERQNINVQEALNIIQQNRNNPDFVILDVRTASEFNSGHISGAINIDIYAPDFELQVGRLERNKQYLVYCRTGNRSTQAVQIMTNLGFSNIYHMIQGITRWTASGYPVE